MGNYVGCIAAMAYLMSFQKLLFTFINPEHPFGAYIFVRHLNMQYLWIVTQGIVIWLRRLFQVNIQSCTCMCSGITFSIARPTSKSVPCHVHTDILKSELIFCVNGRRKTPRYIFQRIDDGYHIRRNTWSIFHNDIRWTISFVFHNRGGNCGSCIGMFATLLE